MKNIVLAINIAFGLFSCGSEKKIEDTVHSAPNIDPDYIRDRKENKVRAKTDANGAYGPGTGFSRASYASRAETMHKTKDSIK